MTTIPATQGVIADSGNFTISDTPTNIAVKGPESYLLLYLPDPGVTPFNIEVSVQYVDGGDFMPAMLMAVAPLTTIPGSDWRANDVYDSAPSRIFMGGSTADDDRSNRVWMIPCFGAQTVQLTHSDSTLANCRVKHIVGPLPYVNALTRPQRSLQEAFADIPTTNTPYALGDVIGGLMSPGPTPNFGALVGGVPTATLRGLTLTDGALGYGELDIIIFPSGSQPPFGIPSNGDPLDMPIPGAILAWLEFRDSPTGTQLPIRDVGTSKVYVAPSLDIDIRTFPVSDGWFDFFVVTRDAVTPDAGNGSLTILVEI